MDGVLETAAFLWFLCAQVAGIAAVRALPPDRPGPSRSRLPAPVDRRTQLIELGGGV